jgi:DNA-binding CsgD family transcriptional regulator
MKAVVSSPLFHAHAGASRETLGTERLSIKPAHEALGSRDQGGVRLTPRQLEVLALLCEGLPNKLICRQLSISAGTVKAHISGILRELGVTSRLQAVVAARRYGLVGECGLTGSRPGEQPRAGVPARVETVTVRALDFGQRTAHSLTFGQQGR